MGEIYKVGGNGMGGASSDDCTATASQVLAGVTAVTKDSNDEPITGTMPSQNQMTFANDCWWNATNGLGARMTPAYAAASGSTNPYVYVPASNVQSALGISAANIKSGVSIAGVTGTMVDYGASRTVFNNGTFDGVYVTGMSQNWVAHRNACGLGSGPVDSNIALEKQAENSKYKSSRMIIGTFDYALDMTPFKSVTVSVHNYGYATASVSYKTATTDIFCYILDTSGTKVGFAYSAVGDTTYNAGNVNIDRWQSATFDISSYSGVYGLVFATQELGLLTYYGDKFYLSLTKVTFNA